MYIKDYVKSLENKNIKIFVDMDGTIVDYVVGSAENFDLRRPLTTNIAKLEEISHMENVELYILSIARMHVGIEEKESWLNKFAPFFKKENRVIIAREDNDFASSSYLKSNFLKNVKREENTAIIIIDDDPIVLKEIGKTSEDVIRLKDTALVD